VNRRRQRAARAPRAVRCRHVWRPAAGDRRLSGTRTEKRTSVWVVDGNSREPGQPAQQPITGVARAACVLVSFTAFVAGGFATFKTDNEIGTSALLAVGMLAGIVALLQRIPKIKLGENEIDPGVVAAVVHKATGEVANAAEAAAREDRPAIEVAKSAREAADAYAGYDSQLVNLLAKQKLLDLPWSHADESRRRWIEYERAIGENRAGDDEDGDPSPVS